MIKNERGYALVLVLVIMLALFMLGTALISVSTSQVREAVKQQERLQAYYLAYSGANSVVEWVMDDGDVPVGTSDVVQLDMGSFYVKVDEDNDIFTVTSYGTNNGYTETVNVSLTRQVTGTNGGFPFPTDMAVFATAQGSSVRPAIEITGSTIVDGPIGTNSTGANSVQFGWSTYLNGDLFIGSGSDPDIVVQQSNHQTGNVDGGIYTIQNERAYPELVFPDFPTGLIDRGSYTADWYPIPPGGHRISEDGYYSSISVPNQLTIDVGNEDRIIRVGTLDVSGGSLDNIIINRTGNGRLILYVDSTFIFGGAATINNNGSTEALILYYAGSNTVNFIGNERFFGNVFVKEADLVIGGSAGITGNILTGGENVEINGAADAYTRLLYAPNAHVKMTGSSKLRGLIIANTFDGGSGNRVAVTYEPIDESIFPFDFSLFQNGSSNNGGSGDNNNVTWSVLQWSGGSD